MNDDLERVKRNADAYYKGRRRSDFPWTLLLRVAFALLLAGFGIWLRFFAPCSVWKSWWFYGDSVPARCLDVR